MYSSFLNLNSEADYRQHYYMNYCSTPITTCHGIDVLFDRDTFDHAFYKRKKAPKDTFDLDRALRMNWIKKVLQDGSVDLYIGWDSKKKRYDSNSRVSLVTAEGYVVIIRFTNKQKTKAKFVTAFIIDDINVLEKIKNGRKVTF